MDQAVSQCCQAKPEHGRKEAVLLTVQAASHRCWTVLLLLQQHSTAVPQWPTSWLCAYNHVCDRVSWRWCDEGSRQRYRATTQSLR